MGRAWADAEPASRAVFDEADAVLAEASDDFGPGDASLSHACFEGPAERLNATVVSQPAIFASSVASWHGLRARGVLGDAIQATAGLSLGEYTALHLAGVLSFPDALRLVARRGRLMQDAAEASAGGMVALIGADEAQADAVCAAAAGDDILVPANYNAPGQIVLSGHATACDRAVPVAEGLGLRATALTVAGAFHSPLMQTAADGMRAELAAAPFQKPNTEVWSNVTGVVHDPEDMELLRARLVEQIVRPVRWAQICAALPADDTIEFHELAPGSVLRGLMRRINRSVKVIAHDTPKD
jgi:[acyl-carrier-protein] S-malonyltransferase